jgi:flagellar M-ring protein FliF
MEMARPIAALAIAAIVFAVFFFMLRRAKPEEISFELVDDAAMAANTKALEDADDSQQFLPASKNLKVSPELLNSLIRQKPENVGATLREWLITKDES